MSDLTKKGILLRTGRCEYEMDPNLFAKGGWHEIYKRRSKFKLEISYNEKGDRTFIGSI